LFTEHPVALDRPADDRPETPKPPPPPDTPTDVARLTRAEAFASHRYWNEVARVSRLWDDHKERWPSRPTEKPDRSDRGKPPEEVADSIEHVAAVETTVSADILEIAAANSSRGRLEGFEFRLKGEERLEEKILTARESSSPDASVTEIVQQIPDAIRYTFCFSMADYTAGYNDVMERLEERGYHIYKSRNFWASPEYKGINTGWVTSEGQRFEVQFHTPESFHAKHDVTHEAYERIRDPATTAHERRDLSVFQREVSSSVPVPKGASDIAECSERGY
jgi:hypothetical protein